MEKVFIVVVSDSESTGYGTYDILAVYKDIEKAREKLMEEKKHWKKPRFRVNILEILYND